MTEAEWLSSGDPKRMSMYTCHHTTQRKIRLFVCACSRRIQDFANDEGRLALSVAENRADGLASDELVASWRENVRQSHECVVSDRRTLYSAANRLQCALRAIEMCLIEIYNTGAIGVSSVTAATTHCAGAMEIHWKLENRNRRIKGIEIRRREQTSQSHLLRDIYGNPFRPVTLDQSWLTSNVLALANGIYTEKAFDRMPILADALQDAGCDNEDILNHCRQPGVHVRGCWVLDLVLVRH